jgi:AraC family transcriptional regulator, transcriptional activator of pobA
MYNSNMQDDRTIHVYNLFGEAGDLPDVVHCETIPSRSVLHDWKLAPHRHARLHQVLLIESGGGQATLDGQEHALRPMHVINVPLNHVHGFSFLPGTDGYVLTIAAEVLDEALLSSEGLRGVLSQPAIVRGTPRIRATMKQIFAEHAARHFARAHILRALSSALIGLVARELAVNGAARQGAANPDLVRRFEELLDQHLKDRWSVSQYAAALSVTPAHLSRVARSATGHCASDLILHRTIREARRNLVYTNLPISTIAYTLGFDDPAYFSRVYSTATGLSPSAFRESLHSGDS